MNMYLQKNFNYLKSSRGLSYRDISKETQINMHTITTLLKGNENNIRIETVMKLADFFDFSVDVLISTDIEEYEKTHRK